MRPKTAVATSSAQVPGPGTYRIESSVGRDAPAASISGRFDLTTDSYQPGPGAYDVRKVGEVGSDAPAFTMAGRPTAHNDSTVAGKGTPGPGQYSSLLLSSAPSISMQGRYEEKADASEVGPGSYDVAPIHDGPEFSMASRFNGSSSLYAATTNPMHFVQDRQQPPRGGGGQRPPVAWKMGERRSLDGERGLHRQVREEAAFAPASNGAR